MLSGRCAHSASASYSQSVQLTFLVHLRAYTQRDTHRGTAITRIWAYPTPARRTERVQDGAEHVAHAERVLEAVRVHVADLQRLQPVREHAVRAARLRSRVRLPHDVLHLRARTRASGCQSRPGGAQARGQAPPPAAAARAPGPRAGPRRLASTRFGHQRELDTASATPDHTMSRGAAVQRAGATSLRGSCSSVPMRLTRAGMRPDSCASCTSSCEGRRPSSTPQVASSPTPT